MKRNHAIVALLGSLALCGAAPALAEEPAEGTPPIIGAATAEQLLKITPEWKSLHHAYEPDTKSVASIREAAAAAPGELAIEVIFGSWCSDSREQIPRLIKVLELAGGGIPAVYSGVPKAREERGEAIARLKLTAIPTILVSRRGAEIGRISETPQASLEEDLAAILRKP